LGCQDSAHLGNDILIRKDILVSHRIYVIMLQAEAEHLLGHVAFAQCRPAEELEEAKAGKVGCEDLLLLLKTQIMGNIFQNKVRIVGAGGGVYRQKL
jgi:hypothetical protein